MATLDIRSLLPQKGPMALLDRVIAADEESLCAEVTIRSDGLFCAEGGVGGWIGIEYMAQAIAAYAGYIDQLHGEPVKLGFLLGTRRYVCTRPVFAAGSVLRVHVQRIFQSENGLGSFECRIEDRDGPVATATLTVFRPARIDEFVQGSAK